MLHNLSLSCSWA